MSGGKKDANGGGSKARRRKDDRYETRAVLDAAMGRRRVSFYGKTGKEAIDKKIETLANQKKGILFLDPKGLSIRKTSARRRPLHVGSKMLGHSDLAMTLRRYAHVLEDMEEDAALAMDELF